MTEEEKRLLFNKDHGSTLQLDKELKEQIKNCVNGIRNAEDAIRNNNISSDFTDEEKTTHNTKIEEEISQMEMMLSRAELTQTKNQEILDVKWNILKDSTDYFKKLNEVEVAILEKNIEQAAQQNAVQQERVDELKAQNIVEPVTEEVVEPK